MMRPFFNPSTTSPCPGLVVLASPASSMTMMMMIIMNPSLPFVNGWELSRTWQPNLALVVAVVVVVMVVKDGDEITPVVGVGWMVLR